MHCVCAMFARSARAPASPPEGSCVNVGTLFARACAPSSRLFASLTPFWTTRYLKTAFHRPRRVAPTVSRSVSCVSCGWLIVCGTSNNPDNVKLPSFLLRLCGFARHPASCWQFLSARSPHDTLLVVDASVGRNAVDQARTWKNEVR